MILAEKIAMLRKQKGWSQEELAMKLDISRQSVSKWESTASVPDLDKIIKLSEIFGVSTDYLLKDDAEETLLTIEEEPVGDDFRSENLRSVSLEEANKFMNMTENAAKKIALGVSLCILSPIVMIILGGLAEFGVLSMSEDVGGSIGAIILMAMVGIAVAIFILIGMPLEKYDYMEKENFLLEYGVQGIVEKKRKEFEPIFRKCIAIGVVLCILSVVPLFLSNLSGNIEIIGVYSVGILLAMVACGVYLFVWSGMIKGSYDKLLQEGDYTIAKKKVNRKVGVVAGIYWCLITAIYLWFSFSTMRWDRTWIIWPCAGVLFAAIVGTINAIFGKE